MYAKYYGLSSKPFDLTPDPERVFMSATHKEALSILKYGVIDQKGFLVITGEIGTGKTTLLQVLVHSLDMGVHLCLLTNPTLTRAEFLAFIAKKLGIAWEESKTEFLFAFEEFLKQCYRKNERVLLIVDEAHLLSVSLLEEIRLISNHAIQGQDVLSIFLVGQPELNDRLRVERLRPLRDRIGIRFHLEPFDREETREYILFRLRHAGSQHLHLFTDNAINRIYQASCGTPRLINIICDQALLTGYADNKPVIDADIIKEVLVEMDFPTKKRLKTLGNVSRKESTGLFGRIGRFFNGLLGN